MTEETLQERYMIEELRYIRTRVESFSSEIARTELYSFGGVATAVGFFLLHFPRHNETGGAAMSVLDLDNIKEAGGIVLGVAMLFIYLYGWVRYLALMRAVREHDRYIATVIEPFVYKDMNGFGFVQQYDAFIRRSRPNHRGWRELYWLLGTVSAAAFTAAQMRI